LRHKERFKYRRCRFDFTQDVNATLDQTKLVAALKALPALSHARPFSTGKDLG
jgi:hypothetical protein